MYVDTLYRYVNVDVFLSRIVNIYI